MIRFNVYINNT